MSAREESARIGSFMRKAILIFRLNKRLVGSVKIRLLIRYCRSGRGRNGIKGSGHVLDPQTADGGR